MATQGDTILGNQGVPTPVRGRRLRGALLLVMGCLAILSPFLVGTLALFLVGLLLIVCGVLEMLETFQAPDEARLRSAYLSGILAILPGILLLAQPQLVLRGLALFLAGSSLTDGIGSALLSPKRQPNAGPAKCADGGAFTPG